jgi:peptidoglycan/xylan/chitin deacetylase (PgdA/CDA1 family)
MQCGVAISVDVDAESVDMNRAPHANLWGRFSHGRYAIRVGAYRLLEVFKEHGMRATFFVPAWDAERAPALVEAIVADGHEVAAHGYRHEDHSRLGDEERATLERAHEALTRIAGQPPRGWRAPEGLLSSRTLGYLAELGYIYDASFRDDDLPHEIACGGGRSMVEIPQFPFLNDTPFYEVFRPPAEARQTWLEELAAIHEDGLLFSLKLHPRGDTGSGRLQRAAVVGDVCRALRERPGTWTATHAEIAEWWSRRQPRGSGGSVDRIPRSPAGPGIGRSDCTAP